MKILPVVAEWFHVDRQTDRFFEASSHFSKFHERASTALNSYMTEGHEKRTQNVAKLKAINSGETNRFYPIIIHSVVI